MLYLYIVHEAMHGVLVNLPPTMYDSTAFVVEGMHALDGKLLVRIIINYLTILERLIVAF